MKTSVATSTQVSEISVDDIITCIVFLRIIGTNKGAGTGSLFIIKYQFEDEMSLIPDREDIIRSLESEVETQVRSGQVRYVE